MKKKKRKRMRLPVCYVRTHRRLWGLTQAELASLIGLKSPTIISRVEHSKCAPTVEVALACQVIFGLHPSEMFPNVHALVEERIMRNVYRHHLATTQATTLSGMRKQELFGLVLHRAISRHNKLEA